MAAVKSSGLINVQRIKKEKSEKKKLIIHLCMFMECTLYVNGLKLYASTLLLQLLLLVDDVVVAIIRDRHRRHRHRHRNRRTVHFLSRQNAT